MTRNGLARGGEEDDEAGRVKEWWKHRLEVKAMATACEEEGEAMRAKVKQWRCWCCGTTLMAESAMRRRLHRVSMSTAA